MLKIQEQENGFREEDAMIRAITWYQAERQKGGQYSSASFF